MILHFDSIHNQTIPIVEAVLQATQRPDDLRLRLALEELIENIVQYAYTQDGALDIEITLQPNDITLCFRDQGLQFNPLTQAAPDLSLPLEQRAIGGLGIHIAKQIMTDMSYDYKNNTNNLLMHYRYAIL